MAGRSRCLVRARARATATATATATARARARVRIRVRVRVRVRVTDADLGRHASAHDDEIERAPPRVAPRVDPIDNRGEQHLACARGAHEFSGFSRASRPHGSPTNAPPPPPSGPERRSRAWRSHGPGEPYPRGQDSEPRHQEEHVTSAAGSSATAQHAAPPAAGPARRVARRQPRPTAELISP